MAKWCSCPIGFDDMTKRRATGLGDAQNACTPALGHALFPLVQGHSMAKLLWRFSGQARQNWCRALPLSGRFAHMKREGKVLPFFCFPQRPIPSRVRVGRPVSLPSASAARAASRCGAASRRLHLPLSPRPSTMRNAFVPQSGCPAPSGWGIPVSAARGGRA